MIFQFLYNLIGNAIRYNKESGSISITEHCVAGHFYILRIKDTGIGIRREELGTIFNRFKKSKTTDGEGYGLGLSIAKSIAVYHDTSIQVNSEFGIGTDFTIIFSANITNL